MADLPRLSQTEQAGVLWLGTLARYR